MSALPFDIGVFHFVGIGGIGMSGIAEILHNLGYSVRGTDIADGSGVRRLRSLGIEVAIGHDPTRVAGAAAVVISSAIGPDNPEVLEARARLIPVVPRAEMLAELMRLKWSIAVAGTHGKTTTTSIVAAVLDAGGFHPTVVNGGVINAYGTNARLGKGDWIVVEADESDGTFVKLPATIAVTTNIDREHLDHYGDFESLKRAFVSFIQNIPFYGFATLCIDDPEVQALIPSVSDRRIVTYGFSPQADFRITELTATAAGASFAVAAADRVSGPVRELGRFTLPMAGEHNARNALAAIAIADEMGIGPDTVRRALAGFGGVRRRFTKTGVVNDVTVIDDYGHHPREISAVLAATRATANGKVVAVLQPHRYSRVRDLFHSFCTCFDDADVVVVGDIYAAGEEPIQGIDRAALVQGLRAHGHRRVIDLEDPAALAGVVAGIACPGDFVVCLGAGDVTRWAHELPESLCGLWKTAAAGRAGGA